MLLLQVPPVGVQVRVVADVGQMAKVPLIGDGDGLTVTVADVVQPVGRV